jgi:heterodisulfide reductase subunit C
LKRSEPPARSTAGEEARMIDLADANKGLWREVTEHNDIRYCFNCGTCIAGCPASNADPPLLIRSLVRMVLLGLEDELLEEDTPWSCVTCSRCEEMCPMGVRPFEVCLEIRKWQCHNDETRIPMATAEVYKRGYTQPVEKVEELRASVGLTEKLPTIDQFPELHAGFQAMLMEVEVIQDADYMYKE